MGLLRHIRSRSKVKPQGSQESPELSGPDILTTLPKELADRIFEYVCAHTKDETFEVCEKSVVPGCGLCDLRDLYNCALVNRRWYLAVQRILYRSVRLDALHFCPLEEAYSESRRRKNIDPSSILPTRLRLFERTAWARPDIASSVLFFKLAHQARGANISTLARIVSALPNIQHVDLPDGFYSAEPSTHILRDQLQAHCWDIRRMKYKTGAEHAFRMLGQPTLWTSMEVLELDRLNVDVPTLRHVLASLPALQELSVSSMPRVDDTAFKSAPNLPPFPPLHKLRMANALRITSTGLIEYTSRAEVREVLSILFLQNTGVSTGTLHTFLSNAVNLRHLSITQTINDASSFDAVPPMSSNSLKTLNYELSSPNDAPDLASSHYAYLSRSLLARALPNLRDLYVLDGNFVDSLQVAPALPPLPTPQAPLPASRLSSNNPYADAFSPTSLASANRRPPLSSSPSQSNITSSASTPVPLSIHAKPSPTSSWNLTALSSTLPLPMHPNVSLASSKSPSPAERQSRGAFPSHRQAYPYSYSTQHQQSPLHQQQQQHQQMQHQHQHLRATSVDTTALTKNRKTSNHRVSVVVPAPGPGGGFLAVPPLPDGRFHGGGGGGGGGGDALGTGQAGIAQNGRTNTNDNDDNDDNDDDDDDSWPVDREGFGADKERGYGQHLSSKRKGGNSGVGGVGGGESGRGRARPGFWRKGGSMG